MENAVAASLRSLLVLTQDWVDSQWTRFESLLIQHRDPAGVLQSTLPLLLEPCDVPDRIGMLTRADFTGDADNEKEFAKLLKAIRGERNLPDQKRKTKAQSEMQSENKNPGHTRHYVRPFFISPRDEANGRRAGNRSIGSRMAGILIFALHL